MRRRKYSIAILTFTFGLIISFLIVEMTFRFLEKVADGKTIIQGACWIDDPRWGWKPVPGDYHHKTPEFDTRGRVNRFFMNDREEELNKDSGKVRVLVLGDSHTFATGVSTEHTWAKQLESMLNEGRPVPAYRVYNAGVTGYSMHQYVSRLRDDGERLKPQIVVVGVSFATDIYDLLPPGRGGWIYGGDRERDYYDFDDMGRLVARHWKPAINLGTENRSVKPKRDVGQTFRSYLEQTATFRYLRRSHLFLFLGSKITIGGQSLWPNMEVAMEKVIAPSHEYQHRLFRALLAELKLQSEKLNAKLVVVGIPYLPQVYEDLQKQTFSGDKYDAWAMDRRVLGYCREIQIDYVGTQALFRERHRQTGRWLHFPNDAHPTVEGHKVIAEAVLSSGFVSMGVDRKEKHRF